MQAARRRNAAPLQGPARSSQENDVAFPLLCWIVLAVFLGCLGLLALAVTRVVTPDGAGQGRSLLGGCAALLALVFFGALGCVGLAAGVGAIAVGTVVDRNPITRVEIRHAGDDAGAPGAAPDERSGSLSPPAARSHSESAVQALFTVKGEAGGELARIFQDLFELDLSELDDVLTVHERTGPDGSSFQVYEFRLPISERDLERFERDVRRELEGVNLRLPESVALEFEGAASLDR